MQNLRSKRKYTAHIVVFICALLSGFVAGLLWFVDLIGNTRDLMEFLQNHKGFLVWLATTILMIVVTLVIYDQLYLRAYRDRIFDYVLTQRLKRTRLWLQSAEASLAESNRRVQEAESRNNALSEELTQTRNARDTYLAETMIPYPSLAELRNIQDNGVNQPTLILHVRINHLPPNTRFQSAHGRVTLYLMMSHSNIHTAELAISVLRPHLNGNNVEINQRLTELIIGRIGPQGVRVVWLNVDVVFTTTDREFRCSGITVPINVHI